MTFGCDFGSRRLALFRLEGPQVWIVRLPSLRRNQWEDRPAALREMGLWVAELVPPAEPLWIEGVISGREAGNVDTAIKMAQTSGAVCAHHTLTYFVAQSTWKKGVVGHGHADKPAVASWLAEHHPALSEACQGDQDAVDAACIALFGRAVAEGRVEAPGSVQRKPRRVLRSGKRKNAEVSGGKG